MYISISKTQSSQSHLISNNIHIWSNLKLLLNSIGHLRSSMDSYFQISNYIWICLSLMFYLIPIESVSVSSLYLPILHYLSNWIWMSLLSSKEYYYHSQYPFLIIIFIWNLEYRKWIMMVWNVIDIIWI